VYEGRPTRRWPNSKNQTQQRELGRGKIEMKQRKSVDKPPKVISTRKEGFEKSSKPARIGKEAAPKEKPGGGGLRRGGIVEEHGCQIGGRGGNLCGMS